VERVNEIPLVVESSIESITRTKQAISALKALGAYADVLKAKNSRKLRRGKGKMRNRRHVNRRGPLIIFNEDHGISRAFRNLPGVEVAQVNSLNLLQLAPGGHLGRFVLWTAAAFAKLNANWGSFTRVSTQKTDYTLPRPLLTNSDLTRLINSDEVQSKVRAPVKTVSRFHASQEPIDQLGCARQA
jgi:large subunit ribosomal protein L4e